ncbi:S41 family peptidase [Thalassobacillus devorans]|uniref:S41 family peptidase n=1 Tax=Thalassobacillus devorans TaxID=279813 RepID=UPI00048E3623|nr:S41 family peptidase [Thalassobacillus devorans]
MNLKKSHVVILLVAALLLGAAGSFFGIKLAQSEPGEPADNSGQTDQKAESFADLSESERQSILEKFAASNGKNGNGSADMKKVEQAYNIIQENYVQDVEKKQLIEGAIQGMLETLDDPYSVYMDKETMKQFDQSIESSFEGIGAEVSMVDDKVTIVAPIKGSPAEEAGLKPNDQILAVDGESVEGLDLYETVLKIRGEKGTEVSLKIDRPGVSDPLTIKIVRDDIPLETVHSEIKEVDGQKAGVIEITSFSEKTSDEFKKALDELESKGMEGLIIDVRGNPGGLFTDVQEILKNFIPDDVPYVQVEDKNGKKERYYSNTEKKKDYPVTVLMDEGSASASEILAAAMKEAGGYELVGETTFGKGTVQQAIPMGDGSTIKITLYKWLTPEGNWIHDKGVKPTIKVKQPAYFYTNPVEIEKPLKFDQNSEKIKNIQLMLKGLGYELARTDGYFDKSTEEAVEKFQKEEGLEVTGVIDQKTGGSIESKIVELIRDEKNDKQMEKALEVLFQQ